MIAGRNVLIVDDICSKGGTFYHSAKRLKEAGAANIYLYITHCEQTIFEGELLKDDSLIKHIFTTNTIFLTEHNKITFVE
jgi:ribose-phosphate pyrophosphokinase